TERAITVINESIAQFELHHADMVTSFLESQQFAIKTGDGAISADRGNDTLTISLDSLGRVKSIDGTLNHT
ncbi:MAG: hypothetical protein AAF497_10340, partial [Planctomycetota bacterium]